VQEAQQAARSNTPVISAAAAAAVAAAAAAAAAPEPQTDPVSEAARQNLTKTAAICKRYGWISFWVQLTLTTVAGVISLFSMAFSAQVGWALLLVRSTVVS
jgi:hypothetical protein